MVSGIEYVERGTGQAVVCLHGIGGSANSFAPQLSAFSGLRLVAWNMPGYGNSETRPLSFEGLSEALGELIAALGLGRVHLLGHSIGGMLALEHAIRVPQHVRSLALLGTTPRFGGRDERFKREFLRARLSALDAGMTMTEMAVKAAPGLVGSNADASCTAAVETELAKVRQDTWRSVLECLVTFDRSGDLSSIERPVCVIAGSQDENAPARTMRKMADRLPNAVYHEVEGAGHMLNQEAPMRVNSILEDFYDGI